MGDVIHATEPAIEIVRTRQPFYGPNTRALHAACDGAVLDGEHENFFGSADARFVLGLDDWRPMPFAARPTCPTCRVLLDAALEQRDLTPLLKVKP